MRGRDGGEGGRGDRWKWERENEKERVRVEKRIIGWDKTGQDRIGLDSRAQ